MSFDSAERAMTSEEESNVLKHRKPSQPTQSPRVFIDNGPDGQGVSVCVFVKPIPASLRCPICWELFQSPVVVRCGHSFCRACVLEELPRSGRCPLDMRPIDAESLQPDLELSGKVGNLKVHCTHACVLTERGWEVDAESGCPEVVRFGLRHVHEQSCEYALVPCPRGGKRCGTMPALEVAAHLRHSCPHVEREAQDAGGGRAAPPPDAYDMATYLAIWGLILYAALQTRLLAGLVREVGPAVTTLLAVPFSIVGLLLITGFLTSLRS
eukprot:jgi/Mesvir1/928/Mv17486-RA.1